MWRRHLLRSMAMLVGAVLIRSNEPPAVQLLFPRPKPVQFIEQGMEVKLTADARDPDGSVAEVRFFADQTFLGSSTNAPYSLVWKAPTGLAQSPGSAWSGYLTAVAIDNDGAASRYPSSVFVISDNTQGDERVAIVAPRDGEVFAAPASFEFQAFHWATDHSYGPGGIGFYVGTNLIEQVAQEPFATTVTNLPPGEYELSLKFKSAFFCVCETIKIRVSLLGINYPHVDSTGSLSFEIVTSKTNQVHEVQISRDLANWTSVLTTNLSTSKFSFGDPLSTNRAQSQYYRVRVR